LLCRVQFTVRARTSVGQYVAVIGDRKVLGSWNPTQAMPLTRAPSQETDEQSTWSGHVYLPVKVPTKYRCILKKLRWSLFKRYYHGGIRNPEMGNASNE
jgi:hypothetical protein